MSLDVPQLAESTEKGAIMPIVSVHCRLRSVSVAKSRKSDEWEITMLELAGMRLIVDITQSLALDIFNNDRRR
jgi:hypothetical protein